MITDYNPYQVIPETTANRMAEDLNLAIEMASKYCPHLVTRFAFTKQRYLDTARGFVGSEKIPGDAKLLFKKQ